jgi:very-short-patch-repair endonuclease
MAAVLAGGAGSAVSHRSAAVVWHLLPPRDDDPIDITVQARSASRPGLRVHATRSWDRGDRRHLRGLPVTSPARTVIDLADMATDRELERATHEALTRRLFTAGSLLSQIKRYRGRRGIGRLRTLLEQDDPPALTRSEAEERFLALVREARLPAPEVNIRLHGYEVDFFWRDERLVVEVDGYQFHSSRTAFERDRRRDADLQNAGLRTLRVTWSQLLDTPYATLAHLVRALSR